VSGSDLALSLIEVLAYVADVLQADLDEIADEAYLQTSYNREEDVVRVQFRTDLRPVVCVVFDPDNAYVAAVGGQAGDLTVSFGDSAHGERPPEGFEKIGAEYRQGYGGGTLELGGLGLGDPIWLIAVSRPHGTLASRVRCSETRAHL
jgi:hypothetical protein